MTNIFSELADITPLGQEWRINYVDSRGVPGLGITNNPRNLPKMILAFQLMGYRKIVITDTTIYVDKEKE